MQEREKLERWMRRNLKFLNIVSDKNFDSNWMNGENILGVCFKAKSQSSNSGQCELHLKC